MFVVLFFSFYDLWPRSSLMGVMEILIGGDENVLFQRRQQYDRTIDGKMRLLSKHSQCFQCLFKKTHENEIADRDFCPSLEFIYIFLNIVIPSGANLCKLS